MTGKQPQLRALRVQGLCLQRAWRGRAREEGDSSAVSETCFLALTARGRRAGRALRPERSLTEWAHSDRQEPCRCLPALPLTWISPTGQPSRAHERCPAPGPAIPGRCSPPGDSRPTARPRPPAQSPARCHLPAILQLREISWDIFGRQLFAI